MEIAKTRQKFREAKFFFARLLKKSGRFVGDPEEFEFYLSAFLSAGRSVTFVLQAEEKSRYDAWFSGWERDLPEPDRELLRFMNEQRVAELKRRGAEVQVEVERVALTKVLSRHPPRHPAYGFHWWAPPGTPPEIGRTVHFFELNGTKQEVVATCERYLGLLEKLLHDFEQASPG